MRIYTDDHTRDEWSIISTLKLEDDGKFSYDETWYCYVGSAGGGAEGRWWQSGKTVFFHAERTDGQTYLNLLPGRDRIAFEEGVIIKFSEGAAYRLRPQSTGNIQKSPEESTVTVPPVPEERIATLAPAPGAMPAAEKTGSLNLSPELAVRLRQWIEEMPSGIITNLGKKFNILPLHSTVIYMWGLNLKGFIVWLDHEAFFDTPEPVTDPVNIYAVLVHGARRYRELAELIPPCPEGAGQCDLCGGMGWGKSPGEVAESYCFRCRGMGWYLHAAPG